MFCEVGIECVFIGKFWDNKIVGVYICGGCDLFLFVLDMKFCLGMGWLSFYEFIES